MTNGEIIINKLIDCNYYMKIAFLPYKREMWDSMQTVYEAAIRKKLKTYVVPIPYYTKDINGKFKFNYDDNYNVPIESYENLYSLDFDYAVYHNPYDGENLLVKIDSRFWTLNLKKAHKKLIYIPYYLGYTNKNLLDFPGIKNADFIFADKDIDECIFKDFLNSKGIYHTKVFASGSPKRDLIQNAHEVILLASSVLAFLNNPALKIQQYTEIIEDELERGNTIIYRPHPLLQDMVNSMTGKPIHKKYAEFLNYVNANCIVDHTADISKVMSVCNRMISDPSSIIELWKITEKPYEVM